MPDPRFPRGLSRRRFVSRLGWGAAGAGLLHRRSSASPFPATGRRPRIALLATAVYKYSHAQHFIDRFLEGYGWEGRHHRPAIDLVSLYVGQFPAGKDLARERAQRHGVRIYPTLEEALGLGGSRLAVDGVVIIAEHGDYPKNEKGQKRYPRHAWFKRVVKVFEASGRSVPVFNDKHLSTEWNECEEMVADSRRLDFPFLAGSSLPVTWRLPNLEFPPDTPLQESVSVCYGGIDSYDIHGLETAQCMSERRHGGEAGVRSVQALKGAGLMRRLAERPETRHLLESALGRSHTLTPGNGLSHGIPDWQQLESLGDEAIGYFAEHNDGFQTATFLLNGLVRDFTYAGQLGNGRVESCQMYLPMPPRITTLADFFSPLVHHIETLIHTRQTPYPIERTLLTSGVTLSGVNSLHQGQARLDTPYLNVDYAGPRHSNHWRT